MNGFILHRNGICHLFCGCVLSAGYTYHPAVISVNISCFAFGCRIGILLYNALLINFEINRRVIQDISVGCLCLCQHVPAANFQRPEGNRQSDGAVSACHDGTGLTAAVRNLHIRFFVIIPFCQRKFCASQRCPVRQFC